MLAQRRYQKIILARLSADKDEFDPPAMGFINRVLD
jgi:hypothetical protein